VGHADGRGFPSQDSRAADLTEEVVVVHPAVLPRLRLDVGHAIGIALESGIDQGPPDGNRELSQGHQGPEKAQTGRAGGVRHNL
jgi:hypothetical protein